MRQRQENNHIVDLLFVLGLFFVFTISALFLIPLKIISLLQTS